MSEDKAVSKETIVVNMVNAGVHTRQEILEASGATSGSLASYLTSMRNAARFTGAACCPVEVEVGEGDEKKKIFVVKTYAEVEALKAAKPAKIAKVIKTVEERIEAVQKRLVRLNNQKEKAAARFEANETRSGELRLSIIEAEIELAEIELEALQSGVEPEPNGEAEDNLQ